MGYEYQYNAAMEDMLESIASMSSVSSSIGTLLSVAAYVFTALALYTIANRRGIRKAWLAWIPVLDVWILGSISDQFRYVTKGENKSKRKALLTLSLINAVATVVVIVLFVGMLINAFVIAFNNGTEEMIVRQIVGPAMGMLGIAVLMLALTVAHAIIYYMALYDLYTSCEPRNNTLYLVLSIIPMVSTIAKPLFLFLCRDKDEGMPPRRPESIPEYAAPMDWQQDAQQGKQEWYEVQSEPKEPWNNPEV